MGEKSIKPWLFGSFVRLLYLWLSEIMALIATKLVMKIFNTLNIFGEIEGWQQPTIRACVMLVLTLGIVAVSSYFEGYHFGTSPTKETVAEIIPAAVVHFGLSMLLGFGEWICGCVKGFSGLIEYGKRYSKQSDMGVKDIHLWIFIVVWLGVTLCISLVMIFMRKYGMTKRLADREALYEEAAQIKKANKQ